MNFGLLELISIITAFQLLFFSAFLFTKNRRDHKILAVFLFSNGLFIINFLLFRFGDYFISNHPYFFFIGHSFGYLFGPLLYFYTRSVVYKEYKIKLSDTFHLIPFIIFNLVYSIYFYIYSPAEKTQMLLNGGFIPESIRQFLLPGMHAQILIYLVLSLVVLSKYNKTLKESFSAPEHIKLSWLKITLIAFIAMWITDIVQFIFMKFELAPGLNSFLTFLSLLINFVFANYIIYKGLKQPVYTTKIEQTPKLKYKKSLLSKNEADLYVDTVQDYMQREKPYLIPSLTLNELADKTNVPPRYLSQVINERLNQNFFDFVNSYRIKEVQRILSDPNNRKITVLEALYEAGFNSKSVFNTAFKKQTGMTPTEFKRTLNYSGIAS